MKTTLTARPKARAVFGISNWPESLGEEFLVFRVLPAETDAEAITRAESAYSPDIEFIIKELSS